MNTAEAAQMARLLVALNTWAATIWLYAYGGRDGTSKAWRRFGAGLLFPAGLIGLAVWSGKFSPWMLAGLLAYPAALSLAYGKAWERGLFGLALGACSATVLLPLDLGLVAIGQIVVSLAASLYFGLANPWKNAVAEEASIAACSTVLVPWAVL